MIGARVEHKDEFFIAGFRETVKQGAGIGELWKKLTAAGRSGHRG